MRWFYHALLIVIFVAPAPLLALTKEQQAAVLLFLMRPSIMDDEIAVPDEFDFSNFHSVTLTFTVPSELYERVDIKIFGQWDGEVQDLFTVQGAPGAEKSAEVNVPTALRKVSIEYLSYDMNTGDFKIDSGEVTL